ncbi:MAG: site-specific integrase [Alphaproteobacteria bacterium]|nr:site-specific integrase [Alphaproteobacteria bacterium]
MATQYKKAKIPGIRYKEHSSRKVGIQKDRYYYMYYQLNGKRKEEGLGWSSQGWTERKVAEQLFEIKNNIKLGKHPQSLKEKREMAEKAKREEETQVVESEAERITLKEVFDKYLEVHKTETSEATWKNTASYYRNWIDEKLGKKRLIDITVDDIHPIIATALKKRTTRTADFIKAVFRQIFNFAISRDLYFKNNPAMKIKIKLEDNKRDRFLTQEEAKLLLDELKKHSLNVHDQALLCIYTGMRPKQIFNLQWEHVLWDIDRILLLNTKNGKNYIIPMHPLVKEMLQRRHYSDKEGYIFKARDGEKVKWLSKTFARTVEALGLNDKVTHSLQKVVFYSSRHTYASWLVMNGNDLYTTQKLMGHEDIKMTQRYAHLAPGYLEKAVNSLESI